MTKNDVNEDGGHESNNNSIRHYFVRLLACGGYSIGIIIFLAIHGLLQERIMTRPYGSELFKFSIFLVFWNRVLALVFGGIMIVIKREPLIWTAPFWKYFAISISNTASTACQYESLKYISFPLLMIGKSFKMIPVMLWGIAISRKRYSMIDWATSVSVTGGVILFLLTGTVSSPQHTGFVIWGVLWILGFLVLDGFTLVFQEKLFSEHKTSRYNQMVYVNLGSGLIALIVLLITRTLVKSFHFWKVHPHIVGDTFYLSLAVVAGQWCLYGQNEEFGALVVAATMNVRQVISTIISYVAYHHHISAWQIIAFVIIFSSLFLKTGEALVSRHLRGGDEKKHLLSKRSEP